MGCTLVSYFVLGHKDLEIYSIIRSAKGLRKDLWLIKTQA